VRSRANETLTGAFVLVTFVVVTAALIHLSAPGLIRKQNTYFVYFDNAGGIRAGTEVLLAGRHVGQVVDIESPIPRERRPAGHEDAEALVKVKVDKDARIYNDVTVRLVPFGMLGEMLIDFVKGDEGSGVAASGATFAGERVPGLDAAAEAITDRFVELKETLDNLNELTAAGSDLRQSAANTRQFTDTIKRQPWRLLWKTSKEPDGDASKKKQSENSKH
jgi:ABC-type transporter Mla subunit MlaD